jgi:hypothetical protein
LDLILSGGLFLRTVLAKSWLKAGKDEKKSSKQPEKISKNNHEQLFW